MCHFLYPAQIASLEPKLMYVNYIASVDGQDEVQRSDSSATHRIFHWLNSYRLLHNSRWKRNASVVEASSGDDKVAQKQKNVQFRFEGQTYFIFKSATHRQNSNSHPGITVAAGKMCQHTAASQLTAGRCARQSHGHSRITATGQCRGRRLAAAK